MLEHVKKLASRPKCGDCGDALQGMSTLRPREYAPSFQDPQDCSKSLVVLDVPTVSRKEIVRAFLIEEQKIVKRVLKDQQEKEQKTSKKTGKK